MDTDVSLAQYPDLSDRVCQILREEILSVRLAPGSPLRSVDLARRLGVSRTPVKDALNRLVAEGLVEEVQRRGYYVTSLNTDDIGELQEARLMLELAAAVECIHRRSDKQASDFRLIHRQMKSLVDEQDQNINYTEFVRLDSAFHTLIVAAAGNKYLTEAYKRLNSHLHIYRACYAAHVIRWRASAILHEHAAILSALEIGQLGPLQSSIREHVRNAMRSFEVAKGE